MKKPLLIIFATTLFLQACKLDTPDFVTTGSGSSDSYQPLTTGTYWKYINVLSGMDPDSVTSRVTGQTTTINGRIYHDITSTSKTYSVQHGYYYSGNHIVTLRANTLIQGITIELQIVNDTTAAGHTWTTRITDNGLLNDVPARLFGTVIEKGVTKIIGGKTFTDVIHTQAELQYNIYGNGFETFTTYHFYVAKGVGLIQTDTYAAGMEIGKQSIVDYSIK
jgi:hypothetical protein